MGTDVSTPLLSLFPRQMVTSEILIRVTSEKPKNINYICPTPMFTLGTIQIKVKSLSAFQCLVQ